VVWFTALFPYVVLMILMVRGLFLNGSKKGIEYYIKPDLSKLKDASVWVDAASQTFFSLGPGFGVLMAFASYNDFHHNGYMSEISGRAIKDVAEQGSTLVFIVYPEAIATMPFAPVWAVFFFLMLLTLGLDSSFGGSEAIITALSDEYPILRKHREWFVGGLFLFYFLIGIPSCTDAGVYFVELLQNYAAFFSIIIAVFFEAIAVSWIYGKKYSYILILEGVIISGLIQNVSPTYGKLTDPFYYQYPDWSHYLGWIFALSSVIFIPAVVVYQLLITTGSLRRRIRIGITPWKERQQCLNSDILIYQYEFKTEVCLPNDCRGGDCEIIRYQNGSPCWAGGTCVDVANLDYVCLCPPNYTGKDCRTLLACNDYACHNGGTCIQTAYGARCNCKEHVTGDYCQHITNDSFKVYQYGVEPSNIIGYKQLDPATLAAIAGNQASMNNQQRSQFVFCLTNPCENDGTCFVTNTATTKGICVCRQGYVGDYCENPIVNSSSTTVIQSRAGYCSSNPCLNDGSCVETGSAQGYCHCTPEYRGAYCELSVRAVSCLPNPCKNGGTCIVLDNNQAHCLCTPVFRGLTCNQFSYVPCGEATCHGTQGVCVANYCICKAGYAGPRCDSTDFCTAFPCQNGGTCVRTNEEPYGGCSCPAGFSGPTCSNDPCNPSPCLNGGYCVRKPDNQFYCQCRSKNKGVYCEQVECFPSDALVELKNGDYVQMHNVKINSLVKVINNDNQLSYSPIVAFLHYDSQTRALYKQIHTESNTIIELSSLHLIRRKQKNNLLIDEFVWAKKVVPNDQILVVKQNNNTIVWEKVMFIKDVWKQGLMAPLTDQ
ncbi:unnamed protein product, partial [Didymodactylos carnosus]